MEPTMERKLRMWTAMSGLDMICDSFSKIDGRDLLSEDRSSKAHNVKACRQQMMVVG
jgi:hypothetical protein